MWDRAFKNIILSPYYYFSAYSSYVDIPRLTVAKKEEETFSSKSYPAKLNKH